MLAFFGELPCQRGAAAVAALSSKPTTTVGAAIDKAGNLLTAKGHANPVIDENSQVRTKNRHQGVPGYMRGSSHASRMKSLTFESIEDRNHALLDAAHTDEGEGAARVGDQHGIRPELKCSSSNLICLYMIILDDAHVLSGSPELAGTESVSRGVFP